MEIFLQRFSCISFLLFKPPWFEWKQVIIFSIKLLIVVLWRAVCCFIIIFFCSDYEISRWVVIFQFYIWEGRCHKWLNTLLFIGIFYLRVLSLRLKGYFHAIFEIQVLWANIIIGKEKSKITISICHHWFYYIRFYKILYYYSIYLI